MNKNDPNYKYIQNAEELVKFAEVNHRRLTIFCENCKWCQKVKYDDDTCNHPLVDLAAAQASKESYGRWLVECKEQRSRQSIWGKVVCGPDGLLFEQKETPIGFISRFFGVFQKLFRSNGQ